MPETALFPAPNLHDYAHWIRHGNKPNYQQEKVRKIPTWVETFIRAQYIVKPQIGYWSMILLYLTLTDGLRGVPITMRLRWRCESVLNPEPKGLWIVITLCNG